MADQQRPKAAAFDINRPRGADAAKAVMFPTVPGGLPAIPPSMDGVDAYLTAMRASLGDVAKATQSSLVEAAKALGADVPQAFSYSSMSFMPDPGNYGLMQWPGLNPESLAKISRENLVPQVIVQQRVSDIARYAGLSTHSWKPGWRITLRDASETPTRQDKEDIKAAQRFLWNCNMEGMDPLERDSNLLHPFSWFLRSFAREALVYDGWSIWTDRDSQNRVRAFTNLPAGMIRLAVPTKGVGGNRNLFAALVDETGSPVKPFTRKEMTWNIRNVRLDPSVGNYGFPECYDSATEVLTEAGWKQFDAVDLNYDRFATMNLTTRAFEWQHATNRIERPYVGRMYHLKSKCVDLLVTPGHRVAIQRSDESSALTVLTAEELFAVKRSMAKKSNNIKLPAVSTWQGKEIENKVFSDSAPNAKIFNMSGDDYCALMGMYLAEGYVPSGANKNNTYICQREKSKGFIPFKEVLKRINGSDVYYAKGEFVLCGKAFSNYAATFGDDCYTKFVPSDIMNATPRQIDIFLHYYLLGDGRTQNTTKNSDRRGRLGGVYRCITTTSRRMADQLQELVQKTGFSASIYTDKRTVKNHEVMSLPNKDGSIRLYKYSSTTKPCYTVSWRGSVAHGFSIEEETYAGTVHCVTVPNGMLYVRRNDKAIWCGNCEMAVRLIQAFQSGVDLNADAFVRNSIPNGMLLLKGDYWNQEQIDALMREWTNMKRGISKLWGMPVMAIPEESEVELMQFMDLKGTDVRFKDHMNMMMGVACLVWCFPIRRLGMFVSGHARDNQPVQDAAIEIQGADDPGLPPLLMHVEDVVNPYLLWPRWPNLLFEFLNKNPKEDSRSFQERTKARTWKEARAETDLQPLPSLVKAEYKPMAEIMEMCPEDPGKAGVFQALAVKMLEINAGAASGGNGGSQATPGARMTAQKDPAESQGHGHLGGVRRNSRAEKDSAATNKQENPA